MVPAHKFGRCVEQLPNSAEQLRTAADSPNLVIGTSPERGGEREPRDIPHLASIASTRCLGANGARRFVPASRGRARQ